MKNFVTSFLVLAALGAQASEIKNVKMATTVHVKKVITQSVGEGGFPSTVVKAVAEFGNSCMVPKASELVQIVNYSDDYETLEISLGEQSNTMCPMVYAPVTVKINLGQFTKPNDGLFDKITVNGVAAQ